MENNYPELNEIMIRRKNKVSYPSKILSNSARVWHKDPLNILCTIIKNMEAYGYSITSEMASHMIDTRSSAEMIEYWQVIEPILKQLTGANKIHKPMYPNFPHQVMEASDTELFWNAFIHYISLGVLVPDYEEQPRVPLDITNVKHKLSHWVYEDIKELFNGLMISSVSWSEQDREDFTTIFKTYPNNCVRMVKVCGDIPNKENLCVIVNLMRKYCLTGDTYPTTMLKTATDVLRYVTHLSNGDVSLSTNSHFNDMSKSDRRFVMKALNNIPLERLSEDMWRYRDKWLRVGEIIHPFSFSHKTYRNVTLAFNSIRNEYKPETFASKFEHLINEVNCNANGLDELLKHLKTRPGEFARRLDYVLRTVSSANMGTVVQAFTEVANQVSIPVLHQVATHFRYRNHMDDRIIIPKGLAAKATVLDNNLPRVREAICEQLVKVCEYAICEQLGSRESLGKVYYDEKDFKNMVAPFALRNASSGSRSVIRGSKLPLDKSIKHIRPFVWWTNGTNGERIDVDLSVVFYDDDWNRLNHINYGNLRDTHLGVCHSGDIVDGGPYGGKGASEFIDIDIEQLKKNKNVRYVVFSVNSYTNQTFLEYPCHFGWMERDNETGEVFEPATVEMRINLSTPSTISIPAIYDIKEDCIVWTDLNASASEIFPNNVNNNVKSITNVLVAIMNLNKTTMDDVINTNINARGSLVTNRADADTVFSANTTIPLDENGEPKKDIKIITPWDIDVFIGDLM